MPKIHPIADEPVEGLQLRSMVSQLSQFLENIEQESLINEKYNLLRTEAMSMKKAAEQMLCIGKVYNHGLKPERFGLEGATVIQEIIKDMVTEIPNAAKA